ncbi:MAG: DeoR/GlpR transcriptional regulator [Pirellulales bacterium]|nr:DeoR/GlpR transcriptional regulator [Pirellulales bacterium]
MKSKDRRDAILECLEHQESFSYHELAEKFQTSSMTIRRDVENLCNRGLAVKTTGGVRRGDQSSLLYEPPFASRLMNQRAEKRSIAQCALSLILPGQTIYLDAGTSCLEFARCLEKNSSNITVVSNSVLVCMELGRNRTHRVIGIGGQYTPDNLCFVGPTTEESARRFFVDIAFLSTKGILVHEGTFEPYEPMFLIKKIFAGQCRQVVVLADHTKFGQRSLCKVLDISEIHTVITDELTPVAERNLLEKHGRKVLVAPIIASENGAKEDKTIHAA